jgi:Protein of unknown function (DUF3025)
MRMKQVPEWNRAALLQSPLFAPLRPILARLDREHFPSLQECNDLLAVIHPPIAVQSGKLLQFVPQQNGRLAFEAQYEPRCYLAGEVQMHSNNWHDLLNALVWLTFPRTKAALNARHYHALLEERASGHTRRGAVRDVNTLLDESGVIVAYVDAHSGIELAGLLRNFQWKELFWQRREQVRTQSRQQAMGFYLFGHGLYEKALQPYVGMTGQGLLVKVEQGFFSWRAEKQLTHLDSQMADQLVLPEHCRSTCDLSPVPLLGVPGWAIENDYAVYYDNTVYFRPGRRGAVTL